jgi:hypothetical protein
VIQEISTYSGTTTGSNLVDSDCRSAAMKWAWESKEFIFNLEFQKLIDDILGNK